MAEPDTRRRTFGPVVLLGLAAAGLASVAGTKPWASGSSGSIDSADAVAPLGSASPLATAAESPLAGALALVVLACWGVLLVTRGRFRRAIAVLALVAAVGLAIVTVEGLWSVPRRLIDALSELSGTDTASAGVTGWYAVSVGAAVLCLATTLAAVRLVPSWPEMGSRYDAPAGTRAATDAAADEPPTENIDIWKAIDEGRDPTA
jgi:uncharacterized membrane protein (TIGR02234 family)